MGKTHLLLAIRHEVMKNKPNLNVLYINGESFTNEFITAIERERTREFHEKYRKVDYLLNDDQPTPITIEKIIGEVSRTFNISEKDIKSTKTNLRFQKHAILQYT